MTHIQAITTSDIDNLLDMQRELADYQEILHLWKPNKRKLVENFTSAHPMFNGKIAYQNERAVGYIMYHLRDLSTFQTRWQTLRIDDFFVRSDQRGQTIGEKLFHHTAKEAKRLEVDRITLEVHKANNVAKQIYIKWGADIPTDTIWEELEFSGNALAEM